MCRRRLASRGLNGVDGQSAISASPKRDCARFAKPGHRSFAKDRTVGGPALLGSSWVLLLMIASVARHPSSLGTGLFIFDVTFVTGYGGFAAWVWRHQGREMRAALIAGAQAGMLLGAVFIASHAVEFFAPAENKTVQLIRGAGSVLLMLALFGAAGSAAWGNAHVLHTCRPGLWCASVTLVMMLGFAFTLGLVFEGHAESLLQEPFVASGMSDPGAFLVRNSLEAASEVLVRMTIGALVLSVMGCLFNAWFAARPRSFALLAACIAPLLFGSGAFALWYADSLDRAARPPFVLSGVLSAGIALCVAHPIWSALRRTNAELQV